jgi:NADH dehydrogenase
VLAGNIAAVLSGQPTVPCDIKSRGSLAAIGEHRGVARVGRFRFAGLSAWLIDRAYYLWQIPGWSRKLRIASDWLWDLLFSRDYVQLGAHPNRASTGETRRVA